MRLEKDNAIRLFNCEAPGSEGIKLEEIFYEEKMEEDRKSTRLNSSHTQKSRMPSSA